MLHFSIYGRALIVVVIERVGEGPGVGVNCVRAAVVFLRVAGGVKEGECGEGDDWFSAQRE